MRRKRIAKNIRERKHRLARDKYIGRIAASFTICVSGKDNLFVDEEIYDQMEKILLGSLERYGSDAHIYLFMPDHLHLLLEGKRDDSNLWKCTVDFKQRSGYWLSKNGFKEKWQKDFYDHILRRDEDVAKQVRYILNNPARKRMVSNWREYKFKGSTVYDFDEWE